jgi:hypothetical protein
MQQQPPEDQANCHSDSSEDTHSLSVRSTTTNQSALRTPSTPPNDDYTKSRLNEYFHRLSSRQPCAYEANPYGRRRNPKLRIQDKRAPPTMNNTLSNIHPAFRASYVETGSSSSLEAVETRRVQDSNEPLVGAHYMNSARSGLRHFRNSP